MRTVVSTFTILSQWSTSEAVANTTLRRRAGLRWAMTIYAMPGTRARDGRGLTTDRTRASSNPVAMPT